MKIFLWNKQTGQVDSSIDLANLPQGVAQGLIASTWQKVANDKGLEYTLDNQFPPIGKKLVLNTSSNEYELTEKTEDEKILDGDIPIPNTKKIVNGAVVQKTDNELYQDSVITLQELRDRKIQALKAKETSIIDAGFSYDISNVASTGAVAGTMRLFECNGSARQKIETLLNYGVFPFDWLTHYNDGRSPISMTKTEMTDFYQAMLAYVTPIKQHLYNSESLLLNGTEADVLSFDSEVGWP